jgi:hypothetical protein
MRAATLLDLVAGARHRGPGDVLDLVGVSLAVALAAL